MKILTFVIALILSPFAAVGGIQGIPSNSDYLTLLSQWPDSDTVTVYEGLPHPVFEKAAFSAEKALPGVFASESDYFYPEPLKLTPADLQSTTPTLTNLKHHKAYGGFKLCGGFHADYLVEWKKSEQTVARALVCLGCSEVKFVLPGRFIQTDLTPAGRTNIKELLGKYRQSRPEFRAPPRKADLE